MQLNEGAWSVCAWLYSVQHPEAIEHFHKKLKEHVDSEHKMSVGVLQSEGWKH